MTTATSAIVTKVKNRFNIPAAITTLDTVINDNIADAVDILSQYATEVVVDSSTWTVATTTDQIDTTIAAAGILQVRMVVNGVTRTLTDWHQEGYKLIFDDYPPVAGTLIVTYRTPIAITGGNVNIGQPGWMSCLYNFVYAEFAAFLAGNASAYNVYTQASGARGVDNLLSLSTFYENKAIAQAEKLQSDSGLLI